MRTTLALTLLLALTTTASAREIGKSRAEKDAEWNRYFEQTMNTPIERTPVRRSKQFTVTDQRGNVYFGTIDE